MSKDFIEGQTFEGLDYTGKGPDKGSYKDCTFISGIIKCFKLRTFEVKYP